MMQLVCNNIRLDLYDNTEIQFTESNPLFAFDDIKCERTTQFKLPATATNDRVFELARIPAYNGRGMRVKFDAELQMSGVVKDGLLYITEWTGKEYTAVFVTGEYIGLQALRDAGSVRDYWISGGSILWAASNIVDANTSAGQASVALTRYVTNGIVHPSFDLSDVMQTAYNRLTGRSIQSRIRGFRLIPKEVQGMAKESTRITFVGTGVPYDTSELVTNAANTIATSQRIASIVSSEAQVLMVYDNVENRCFWSIRQLVSKQNIILTFPDNFSDDYFLMSIRDTGSTGSDPEYNTFSTDWFLGGYSFNPDLVQNILTITGTPLKGRSIAVPKNTPFVLVHKSWITWRPNAMGVAGVVYGFQTWSATSNRYIFDLTIEGEKVQVGDYVRVLDILPDKKLTELFKMYCVLTGTVLNYSEAEGVTFDALDFSSWEVVDVTSKLMEAGTVKRTFADYAQRNVLEFESGGDVPANMRVTNAYAINNDNIAEEKTLAKIPYSEGVMTSNNGVVVSRFDNEDEQVLFADGVGIARGTTYDVATPYMQRITIPKNAGLQALCNKSTQVRVRVRMSAFEYMRITPKTKIQCNGTMYVWTDRTWKKNVAELTLAAV